MAQKELKSPRPPQPGRNRIKKWVASAGFGVAVALACRLLPPHWQLPCTIAVKLVSLMLGGTQ